jgi:GNAT superfamily N-acetyltransferase
MDENGERARGYRDAYDAQIRARVLGEGSIGPTVETVGPVVRKTGWEGRGFITYRDLGGLDGDELDAFIAAQRDHFTGLGQEVEWKQHGHDLPADLPERLVAAGFQPEEVETVMIGEVADLTGEPRLPDGVALREVTERADLERIRVMQEEVWGTDCSWMPDALARDLSGPGDPAVVLVAEAGGPTGTVVCAAWIRFHEGTEFASLWGGSTRKEWRGRGIYRATVSHRANLAAARGYRYLQVDASADSRPILERLGLLPVTSTTPFIWRPAASS